MTLAFRPDEISAAALAEGIRNGLPVAIRRGDLDLAKTCFDLLWSEREMAGRAWLRWDMIPLLCAECLPVTLCLPEHMSVLKSVDSGSDHEERAWRKLIYLATLLPKCRDALMLARFTPDDSQHQEARLVTNFTKDLQHYNIRGAVMEVYDKAAEKSDPELGPTYNVLLGRALNDGSISNRMLIGISILLICVRRTKFQGVQDQIDRVSKHMSAKFGRKPKTVDLPWYIWGPETRTGRDAIATMTNKDNPMTDFDKDTLSKVISATVDHHVPDGRILKDPVDKPLSIWNNVWKGLNEQFEISVYVEHDWIETLQQTFKEQVTAVLGRK